MKTLISLIFGLVIMTTSCKSNSIGRDPNGPNIEILVDKTTAAIGELVTVTYKGDTNLPTDISLDWGDGTAQTKGTSGIHKYTKTGAFTITLYFENEPITKYIDNDKVKKTITIK